MLRVSIVFCLAVFVSFASEKHLFCYFLVSEIFVFSVLYVSGFVCFFSHQSCWYLIFIGLAVVESVSGSRPYLSFVRLCGPPHSLSSFSSL